MKRTLFCLFIIMLTLSACSPAAPDGGPAATSAPLVLPTLPSDAPIATAAQPAAPVETTAAVEPASRPSPSGGVLPAPLLVLDIQDDVDQVFRIETDGATRRALTAEAGPVLDFDVSPADGRLAYVAGNDLIVANADGSNRVVLVDGPEMPPENDPQAALQRLGKPRWSPDGARIAYSLDGVYVVPSAGGAAQLLLKSDPLPELVPPVEGATPAADAAAAASAPAEAAAAYVYWPESWSPDGARLLLGYSYYPVSSGLALLDPAGGAPLLIQNPESYACCNPAWSPDSASIYYASPYFGMFIAGLWRASAADGSVVTLIRGDSENGSFYMPGFAQPLGDALYFFYARSDAFPEGQVKLTPVRAAPASDLSAAVPLRSDAWLVGEALWAPDGSGVAIVNLEAASGGQTGMLGQLVYLKYGDSPAVTLPGGGHALRWGK